MQLEDIIRGYTNTPNLKSLVSTFESIRGRFKNSGVTVENVSMIIVALMLEVNKIKKITGAEKKRLVTDILKHFIEEINPEEENSELEHILKTMVPNLIDNFVQVGRLTDFRKLKCCVFG